MSIRSLSVRNFRNLRAVDIEPGPGINVIFGANAAGKTSLLEALHFLGRVRSFRTTRVEQLITSGEQEVLVRAVIDSDGRTINAAVRREGTHTQVRVDGENVRNLSTLAQYFPLQVINSESQRLLLDGPKVRRSFLNWTMFHVEHGYYEVWRRYDRAVRQRNAALRARDARLAKVWEPELVQWAEALDSMRVTLVEALTKELGPLLAQWLPEEDVTLSYRRGWANDRSLEELLENNRERELEAGYCLYGPHRGDIVVKAGAVEAQHRLSRGQQKLLVIAMLLAQAGLLANRSTHTPLLLIDDLPAELDADHRGQVVRLLEQRPIQTFITCIDRDSVTSAGPAKWFHVEHGAYQEVI